MRPFFEAIALYHRYSAPGVENIPHQGRCILAVSHSFATYDAFLLGLAIKKATGRLPVGLGDNLLFNLPGVSTLAAVANLYRANPKNAKRLLEEECLVGVAPGGMREALRSKDQKQQVCWTKRKGFVRLAIQTQSPVVLAACPAADDLYDVYEAYLTKWAYRQYKVPLPVFSGWGPSLLPKPVKLTHHVSRLFYPPPLSTERPLGAVVDEFHGQLLETMQCMMQQG